MLLWITAIVDDIIQFKMVRKIELSPTSSIAAILSFIIQLVIYYSVIMWTCLVKYYI